MCDLISKALNGSKERYRGEDLDLLFALCCRHKVSALVSTVIDKKCSNHKDWENVLSLSILRKTHMDFEREKLTSSFRDNGIWYLFMKGLVLEQLYPDTYLREMCDNDILYDRKAYKLVRSFMLENGYTIENSSKDVHVDEYSKKPYFRFELHKNFFNVTRGRLAQYYEDIERLFVSVDKYEKKLSNEDFYVYMIAHSFKHFIDAGTGIRSFIDCYLYNKKVAYDKEYVAVELKKLGIFDFEQKFSTLSNKLFGDNKAELSDEEEEMFLYAVSSGAYGTKENYIRNQLEKQSKFKYLMQRAFPPLEWYKGNVPFCYKHRWAIPFYCVYRLIFKSTKNSRRIKKEVEILSEIK